jgi:ferredoxin
MRDVRHGGSGAGAIRVIVDDSLCSGHGRCYTLAPTVFESDDDGFNSARGSEVDVAAENVEAAEVAIAACPEGAIRKLDGPPAPGGAVGSNPDAAESS